MDQRVGNGGDGLGGPDGPAAPVRGHRQNASLPGMTGRVLAWLGRTMVYGGLLLALFGAAAMAYTLMTSGRGIEAVAKIEAGRRDGRSFAAAGVLDLSWTDASGARRIEYGVKVTPQLAYKLKIGRQLSRESVRVRYVPGNHGGPITVVEDVPEMVKGSAVLSIVGFLSMTLGGFFVLAGLLWGDLVAARRAGTERG